MVDQLSPHHDSQFLAFSTEVLNQVNRKHNHSSSPFTTLADRAERKVASTGGGQPNYWHKTWFGADAYKAKLATPKYAIKLFGFVGNSFVPIPSPWQVMPRYICETTIGAIFICEKKRIINSADVYWDLSDMPMITLYIKRPQPRLFDMPEVEGGGKRHITGSK